MSALPSLGHVHPCLSLAEALRDAGHEVRLATAPGLAPHVRQAGFVHANLGFDVPRPGEVLTARADRIVVLDDGRVRENGSHDELIDLGGITRPCSLCKPSGSAAARACSARPSTVPA